MSTLALRLRRHPMVHPWYNLLLTTVLIFGLGWLAIRLADWAMLNAVHLPGGPADCMKAAGACWSIVEEKWRFILVGFFPPEHAWRAGLSLMLIAGLIGLTVCRLMSAKLLFAGWFLGLCAVFALLNGRAFGLDVVRTEQWGGLLLTTVLMLGGVAIAFPLGVLLAFGRRSQVTFLRTASTAYIELIRGVPLITVLFMASVVLPLFVPPEIEIVKLVRAAIGIGLCAAAYLAEALRGGLRSIPDGQIDGARSLGLKEWQIKLKIQLPQAMIIATQPILGTFLDFFKGTSLVSIIGLFDLLGAAKISLNTPQWSPYFIEMYMYAGSIYFLICFCASRYVSTLEKRLAVRKLR